MKRKRCRCLWGRTVPMGLILFSSLSLCLVGCGKSATTEESQGSDQQVEQQLQQEEGPAQQEETDDDY